MCCDLKGRALHYTIDSLDFESLAHRQAIVIGWQPLVETWLPKIQEIVQKIT
jgi:hypothetical protein